MILSYHKYLLHLLRNRNKKKTIKNRNNNNKKNFFIFLYFTIIKNYGKIIESIVAELRNPQLQHVAVNGRILRNKTTNRCLQGRLM